MDQACNGLHFISQFIHFSQWLPRSNLLPLKRIETGRPFVSLPISYVRRRSQLETKKREDIKGVSVSRGGTSVSHLFFVNDSIFFCQAIREEWCQIKGILKTYERGSSQMINEQKSSVYFNSNNYETTK